MAMESCVKVKEEPRSLFTVDVCIKKEVEWGEEEPAEEPDYPPSDQTGSLHDCVKAEPSDYEIASSGDFSEAAMLAGLYDDHRVKDELVLGPGRAQTSPSPDGVGSCGDSEAAVLADHVVKDELVLGPECVQKPHVAAVSRERNRESSAVSERLPAAEQPLLRECSVRLERAAAPRRSRRPRAPARAASPASDSEHDVYEKDHICHLCGRRYALKSSLKRHVKFHIHSEPWICTWTQEESFSDSDEEIDVVSLDPPGPSLAAMLLRTNMECRRDSDTDSEPSYISTTKRQAQVVYKVILERRRRSRLKLLFDDLKKLIPATRNKEHFAIKDILHETISLCRRLRKERDLKEEELKSLVKQQSKLLAKLKRVGVSQPSNTERRLAWHGSRHLKHYRSRLQNACPRRKRRCVTEKYKSTVLQKTEVFES